MQNSKDVCIYVHNSMNTIKLKKKRGRPGRNTRTIRIMTDQYDFPVEITGYSSLLMHDIGDKIMPAKLIVNDFNYEHEIDFIGHIVYRINADHNENSIGVNMAFPIKYRKIDGYEKSYQSYKLHKMSK